MIFGAGHEPIIPRPLLNPKFRGSSSIKKQQMNRGSGEMSDNCGSPTAGVVPAVCSQPPNHYRKGSHQMAITSGTGFPIKNS
jgi:hypothetical protein